LYPRSWATKREIVCNFVQDKNPSWGNKTKSHEATVQARRHPE